MRKSHCLLTVSISPRAAVWGDALGEGSAHRSCGNRWSCLAVQLGSPRGSESSSWPTGALHRGQAGPQHRGLGSPGGISLSGEAVLGCSTQKPCHKSLREKEVPAVSAARRAGLKGSCHCRVPICGAQAPTSALRHQRGEGAPPPAAEPWRWPPSSSGDPSRF